MSDAAELFVCETCMNEAAIAIAASAIDRMIDCRFAFDEVLAWPKLAPEMKIFYLALRGRGVNLQLVGAKLIKPQGPTGRLQSRVYCAKHLPQPWFKRAFDRVSEAESYLGGVRP